MLDEIGVGEKEPAGTRVEGGHFVGEIARFAGEEFG